MWRLHLHLRVPLDTPVVQEYAPVSLMAAYTLIKKYSIHTSVFVPLFKRLARGLWMLDMAACPPAS